MKFDPRAISTFKQLGINSSLTPLPAQLKMLASNFSGFNVHARALPNTGKSTAAMLSLAKNCTKPHSGLLLVPSLALATQYQAQFSDQGVKANVLARTGNVEQDEAQHHALKQKSNVLIATPTRLLDYLSFDHKFPLDLQQLVVDELEMFQSNSETPLETLVEHLLGSHAPQLTLVQNTLKPLRFLRLPKVLASPRELVEVSTVTQTDCSIKVYTTAGPVTGPFSRHVPEPKRIEPYLSVLKKHWDGHSLVLVADRLSIRALPDNATAVRYSDLSGMHLKLENLFILGWQGTFDLEKLAATASHITVLLASTDNKALEGIAASASASGSLTSTGMAERDGTVEQSPNN